MTYKAVLFDMYGVLMKWPEEAAWEKLASLALGPNSSVDTKTFLSTWEKYRGGVDAGTLSRSDFWLKVEADLGVKLNGAAYDAAEMSVATEFHPEMVEFLQQVRAIPGLEVAILSNVPAGYEEGILSHLDWFMDVPKRYLSCDLGLAKPDPEIYLHVVKEIGVAPDEAIMIDDKLENCEGAQIAGLAAIRHRNLDETQAELMEMLNQN